MVREVLSEVVVTRQQVMTNEFAEISDRRREQVCGIIVALPGIELRGNGGTNGSLWVETDGVLLRTDCVRI